MTAPYEPSSDMRQLAKSLRDIYQALVLEGFTADEALTIIGHEIVANAKPKT
jgi:hypothetical protein